VACRRKGEKSTLLRWVVDAAGSAVPDPRARREGRGRYVCRTEECVDRLHGYGKRWGIDFAKTDPAFRLAIREEVPQNVAGETRRN
jgi:Protein of unknown function (DUF448)